MTNGIPRASTQFRYLSFFQADREGPFGYRRLRHENTTAFLDACGGMGSFGLQAPVVPGEHVSQRLLFIKLLKGCCLTNRYRYSRYVDVVSGWPGTPLSTRFLIIIDITPKESTTCFSSKESGARFCRISSLPLITARLNASNSRNTSCSVTCGQSALSTKPITKCSQASP